MLEGHGFTRRKLIITLCLVAILHVLFIAVSTKTSGRKKEKEIKKKNKKQNTFLKNIKNICIIYGLSFECFQYTIL